jgi:hypothetical protein
VSSGSYSPHTLGFPLFITSSTGIVHVVPDAVIATCTEGRYAATCGASFTPAAMTEPDCTDDCPLCHARPRTRGRG